MVEISRSCKSPEYYPILKEIIGSPMRCLIEFLPLFPSRISIHHIFLEITFGMNTELLTTLFIVVSGLVGLLFALYQRWKVSTVE